MDIPLDEAKGRMDELVARARAGETIILTAPGQPPLVLAEREIRRGPPATRYGADGSIERFASVSDLFAKARPPSEEERKRRRSLMEAIVSDARANGPSFESDAARSQDFLYDEDGLPG